MDIATTRFGRLEVNEERIISFPKGLLGFPQYQRYALIQTGEENYFFWLQSVDEPTLAFVVTDPAIFFKDYDFALKKKPSRSSASPTPALPGLRDLQQGRRLAHRQPPGTSGHQRANRVGNQIVINDKKWTTRQPLLRLAAEVPLAKSA